MCLACMCSSFKPVRREKKRGRGGQQEEQVEQIGGDDIRTQSQQKENEPMQQNAIQPLQRKTTHTSNTGASQKHHSMRVNTSLLHRLHLMKLENHATDLGNCLGSHRKVMPATLRVTWCSSLRLRWALSGCT